MSQETIDRLRAGLVAFVESGETDAGFLAPDFELHQASSIVGSAGLFHGQTALRDSLRELRESFDDLTFEPETFMEAPGGEVVVLVRARGRGRSSGMETRNRIGWVWTFRDDKAVRLVVYEDPAEALDAVGLQA